MKKLVFLLVLFVFLIGVVNAQDRKNEFNLGVGMWSSDQIVGTLSDLIVGEILTDISMENVKYYGAFHLGYKYAVTDRILVGGVFAFDYGTADGVRNNVKIGEFKRTYYSLAAEADYKYINRQKFKLYSSLGLGASLYHQSYKELPSGEINKSDLISFNFQVSPIGVKFGDQFGGFVELGFGYKGILNLGFLFRF